MADLKNKPTGFNHLDPFRMTNFFIRILWRLTAFVIALAVRIPTSIIFVVVARWQRLRVTRW